MMLIDQISEERDEYGFIDEMKNWGWTIDEITPYVS